MSHENHEKGSSLGMIGTVIAVKAAKVGCLYGVKVGADMLNRGRPGLGALVAGVSALTLGPLVGAAVYHSRDRMKGLVDEHIHGVKPQAPKP